MPTYPFGNNTINDDQEPICIHLQNGDDWFLDYREIIQLAEILANMQANDFSTPGTIGRTHGVSLIEVEKTISHIRLIEGDKDSLFLFENVGNLLSAIEQIVPLRNYGHQFNGIKVRLYEGEGTLYAITLNSVSLDRGIWVFDEAEIQQLEAILRQSTSNGVINRTNEGQVTIEDQGLISLREGSRQSGFYGHAKTELCFAIRQLQSQSLGASN
jgi:hypothetical protein